MSECVCVHACTVHIWVGMLSCLISDCGHSFPYSPIGEVFRSRLRQFPSLVTCCTIDWFSEWPDEALKSVATSSLNELTEIDNTDAIEGLVCTCVFNKYLFVCIRT